MTSASLPTLRIRTAIGFLTHAKTEMYALLATAKIKEFEQYHLRVLDALKELEKAVNCN